jgi:hypothetical protein
MAQLLFAPTEKVHCHDFALHSPTVRPYGLESGGNTLGSIMPSAQGVRVGEASISPANTANIDVREDARMSSSPLRYYENYM